MKILKKNIRFKDLKFGDIVVEKNSSVSYTVLYPGDAVIILIDEDGRTHQVSQVWDELDLIGHGKTTFNQLKLRQLTYEYGQLISSIQELQKHADFFQNELRMYAVAVDAERIEDLIR